VTQIPQARLIMATQPSAVEIAPYRTVQDALSGAEKDGRGKRVRVKVVTSDSEIRCFISNDGPGGNKAASRSSWMEQGPGLIGIRERLAALGGTLACESRADGRGSLADCQHSFGG
jgi:signal transduction histidine kinase